MRRIRVVACGSISRRHICNLRELDATALSVYDSSREQWESAATDCDPKIAALRCYGDEMRDTPHPRSADAQRAIARRWGVVVSVHAAEALEVIRVAT